MDQWNCWPQITWLIYSNWVDTQIHTHRDRSREKLKAQWIYTAVHSDTVACYLQKNNGLILITCSASLGIFIYSQERESSVKLFRYFAVCLHECRLCAEVTGSAGGLWWPGLGQLCLSSFPSTAWWICGQSRQIQTIYKLSLSSFLDFQQSPVFSVTCFTCTSFRKSSEYADLVK